jgi:hypothetical protein
MIPRKGSKETELRRCQGDRFTTAVLKSFFTLAVVCALSFFTTPSSAQAKTCEQRSDPYHDFMKKTGKRFGVCAAAIAAVVHGESCFTPDAKAKTSTATGMMQLIKATGRAMGLTVNDEVDERLDAQKNIVAGTRYLKDNLKMSGDSLRVALAGYYLGPLFVQLWGGVPPEAVKYTNNACRLMKKYEKRMGVSCPASYCAQVSTAAKLVTTGPVRLGLGKKVIEFASGDTVKRLFKRKQITILYGLDGSDDVLKLVKTDDGQISTVSVPGSFLKRLMKEGRAAEIGQSPEVPNLDPALGKVTLYAQLSRLALDDAEVTVYQPRPLATQPTEVTDALDPVGDHALHEAYDGRLVIHPLVERAAQAAVAGWAKAGVDHPFIATLVRTREVHDAFRRVASKSKKRDLGLLGLSAAISNLDYKKRGLSAMKRLADDTRRNLKATLAGTAERLRIEAHKHFVLIELRDDLPEGVSEIASRRRVLEAAGVLKPGGQGIPKPADVMRAK